mmetsp:Transcript_37200/g.44420  ORF Transcript_37200/g.44420 Transcript_37200/m.44420 type:complete len:101 (-) Transcript_37200:1016-1318(-)
MFFHMYYITPTIYESPRAMNQKLYNTNTKTHHVEHAALALGVIYSDPKTAIGSRLFTVPTTKKTVPLIETNSSPLNLPLHPNSAHFQSHPIHPPYPSSPQ